MPNQRRRRRFAVGAGDRNQACAGSGDFALKDLGIADDLDPRGARLLDRPMRLGVGEGNPGTDDQRVQSRKIHSRKIADRQSGVARLADRAIRIVPCDDFSAAEAKRFGAGRPRPRQAEDRDPLALECARRKHFLPQLQRR